MSVNKECVMNSKRQKPRPLQMHSDSVTDDDNSDLDATPDYGTDNESVRGSDEDDRLRYHLYDPKDSNNPKIELGQLFTSFIEFKEAVRTWNIRRGRPFKFIKSDIIRVRPIYPIEGCDWCISVRKMKGDSRLEVRTFKSKA